MNYDTLVFVEVLGFPGGLLSPARAVRAHGNCHRLLESSSDPEHHVWPFKEGDVVRCERRELSEGEYDLVAIEPCTCTALPLAPTAERQ